MGKKFGKILLIAIIISLPAAYIVEVAMFATFQDISLVDAFTTSSRHPQFGAGFVTALVLIFIAQVLYGLILARHAEDIANPDREKGTVKWFNVSKGFGFIERESGEDVFVHYRSIRGEGHRKLVEGQRVEFTVTQGEKGLQADDVIPAAED